MSCREFTSAFGPNLRKMNRLNRGFLEGEGSQGMGGILYGCVGGGGVEAMPTKNF